MKIPRQRGEVKDIVNKKSLIMRIPFWVLSAVEMLQSVQVFEAMAGEWLQI